MSLSTSRPSAARLVAAALAVAVVTGCAGQETTPAAQNSPSATGAFPLTLDNCGITIRLEAQPERVVATSLPGLETAVAVGAADRLVGTAGVVNNLLPEYQEQAKNIPVISEGGFPPPTKEAVLGVDPDFVVAGYEFDFNPDALGDRAKLAADGLQSYLSSGQCGGKATVDHAMTDVENYGKIFAAEDKAAELKAQLDADIAAAKPATGKPTVLVLQGDPTKPLYAGTNSLSDDMITRLGGVSPFPDQAQQGEVSWESIVQADPDVIVISSTFANPAEKTIAYMKGYGPAQNISAVKNDRFVSVPVNDLLPGVRTGQAMQKLAEGLAGL